MHVQVIHEDAIGATTDFGIQELDYLPAIAQPFRVDSQTYYTTKSFIGPDERGLYLLVLEGEPKLVD